MPFHIPFAGEGPDPVSGWTIFIRLPDRKLVCAYRYFGITR
jgi:hypothetical protein